MAFSVLIQVFEDTFMVLWTVLRTRLETIKESYDLPLDLLQYRRENSAEYLYS